MLGEAHWNRSDNCDSEASYEHGKRHSMDGSNMTSTLGSSSSHAPFALGIVMRRVNLIAAVSEAVPSACSVLDPASTAEPMSAMMRRLPEKTPIRILNLEATDLKHCIKTLSSEAGPERCLLLDVRSSDDGLLDRLANALLETEGMDNVLARHYSDALGIAIAARALSQSSRFNCSPSMRSPGKLPKWRLKRVVEYIDTHLDQPITLASLAAPAGLTRMHFAAQFRAATGIRPHEYLLRRRIEFAQSLLSGSAMPIAEIAFSVGFQTQSHFTTVFKRFVGDTPYQWRRSHAGEFGLIQVWEGVDCADKRQLKTASLRAGAATSTN
jgi:AraC-like DNA-binding protein